MSGRGSLWTTYFCFGEETGVPFAMVGRRILQTSLTEGLAQVADEIPLRPHVDGVPGRQIGVPIGPAVVMLSRQHDVLGTDFGEQFGPLRPGSSSPL